MRLAIVRQRLAFPAGVLWRQSQSSILPYPERFAEPGGLPCSHRTGRGRLRHPPGAGRCAQDYAEQRPDRAVRQPRAAALCCSHTRLGRLHIVARSAPDHQLRSVHARFEKNRPPLGQSPGSHPAMHVQFHSRPVRLQRCHGLVKPYLRRTAAQAMLVTVESSALPG